MPILGAVLWIVTASIKYIFRETYWHFVFFFLHYAAFILLWYPTASTYCMCRGVSYVWRLSEVWCSAQIIWFWCYLFLPIVLYMGVVLLTFSRHKNDIPSLWILVSLTIDNSGCFRLLLSRILTFLLFFLLLSNQLCVFIVLILTYSYGT